ncbi:hypothetical protein BGZ51_003250 [Haplosporangium sp. Z 767]|nr:hypothetical protein BGZ51_003250 [Haplosporangium sp. Z 767]KAF9195782.1 hypothetical protein BGZ50_003493 [Haplosporangium sp. Z 11]
MSAPQHPSRLPPIGDGKTPHVMIVGAGLAGLLLGILLDRANIPYQIYERAREVKPLGAVMALNAGVYPVLEQLGLLDEFEKLSLPCPGMDIYNADMSKIATLQVKGEKEVSGYARFVFPRPAFYNLLLSKVSPDKIHFGKKIMSIEQNMEGTMIRCSDGTTYHGDILVGADGAYSAVRQGLYKRLQKKDLLPAADASEMNKGYTCMVGTTGPLDPAKYPELDDTISKGHQIIGKDSPYTWSAFTVAGNKICWNIKTQLASVSQADDLRFRSSEWGPESNEAMINEVKDFAFPSGYTLGDLIDATPRENITRVYLEDKLFETWHDGRTVLIGDACHKLLPSSAQGAVVAMQDAVVLANVLYDLKSLAPEDISDALHDYQKQRYPHVKEQFEAGKTNAMLMYGQTLVERCIRHLVFNYMPSSIQARAFAKGVAYRPQAVFLPQVPNRGTGYVIPQKPSRRYQAEQGNISSVDTV